MARYRRQPVYTHEGLRTRQEGQEFLRQVFLPGGFCDRPLEQNERWSKHVRQDSATKLWTAEVVLVTDTEHDWEWQ